MDVDMTRAKAIYRLNVDPRFLDVAFEIAKGASVGSGYKRSFYLDATYNVMFATDGFALAVIERPFIEPIERTCKLDVSSKKGKFKTYCTFEVGEFSAQLFEGNTTTIFPCEDTSSVAGLQLSMRRVIDNHHDNPEDYSGQHNRICLARTACLRHIKFDDLQGASQSRSNNTFGLHIDDTFSYYLSFLREGRAYER